MIIRENEDRFKISSYFEKSGIKVDLELGSSERDLINALDKYLKLNYNELYNKNNLKCIFEKAREDKEIKVKVFNVISKFILN